MTDKTKGGALDIKDEDVTGNLSDAELRASAGSKGAPDGPQAGKDPVAPVERFDPPKPKEDGRIFQNGDTDRDGE
jgi:hypothetical protein